MNVMGLIKALRYLRVGVTLRFSAPPPLCREGVYLSPKDNRGGGPSTDHRGVAPLKRDDLKPRVEAL